MLLSAQIQTQRSQELAKRLYDGEVERTEEEYETARRSIKERLLEACQERSRKLREEKDSADLNLGALAPLTPSRVGFVSLTIYAQRACSILSPDLMRLVVDNPAAHRATARR